MQCVFAILSSVTGAVTDDKTFPHNLLNDIIFGEKKLFSIQCMFRVSLQHLSEIFFILRRNERDMITNYIGLHEKQPSFLSDFNET